MSRVKTSTLAAYLVFGLLVASCARLPAYNHTVSVNEGDASWEVRLNQAFVGESSLSAELVYANRAGASFSIRPQNVRVEDEKGNVWNSDGRNAHIGLLQPGETKTVRIHFSNVVLSGAQFTLHPFYGLTHSDPTFLLKAKGGTPLPGLQTDEHWDVAK
jgi:hypothetical protein